MPDLQLLGHFTRVTLKPISIHDLYRKCVYYIVSQVPEDAARIMITKTVVCQ